MLRLHTAGPAPTKNPRCRVADEGARRWWAGLSRHADVRGGSLRCARGNNSRRTDRVNFWLRYVLRSGRTLGCPT